MLEVKGLGRRGLLHPVSMQLPQGECGVVMGTSGSGKSLLARAIVDLDPNEGGVRWRGRSREEMPAPAWRRLVGYVPAEPGWWAERAGMHFPADAPDAARAVVWLEAVGLTPDIMQRRVSSLSSGERVRLALVRALVMRPELLILDEPTGALDAATTARVEDLLKALLAGGMTLLLITHDAAQAGRLGRYFWHMEAGRLVPVQAPS